MKVIIPEGRDTNTPYKRFEKVTKALMAVPKKELDKKLAEHGRDKQARQHTKTKD